MKPEYYHVYPLDDAEKHDTSHQGKCWCNPRMEKQENGSWLIKHNSMDGREYFEEDNEKYNKQN